MTEGLIDRLQDPPGQPRVRLVQLPTPLHRLDRLGAALGGVDLWIKRDDLTGLEGGGNKSRKLEFLVGDALAQGADTLATIGAIQSNHTRQTAAAAARTGLKAALLHCAWTRDAGPFYRQVGNILLSSLFGAELYVDEQPRPIEDQTPLDDFVAHLRAEGRRPYLIPGGASEHPLGSLGYVVCAAEIARQAGDRQFDFVVHCTGSGSTQAGLLAGFTALGAQTRVIGVSDDDETAIKTARVRDLADATLALLGLGTRLGPDAVEIIASATSPYGVPDVAVLDAVWLLGRTEGLVADPVYEGRAVAGLRQLVDAGRFPTGARILLMHLGGTPAIHGYSHQFGPVVLRPFSR